MGLRGWMKRLEREAAGEQIEIPLQDGTVKRFPASAARDAMINLSARMGAGENAPPEHPLLEAARNSSDPKWTRSYFAVNDPKWTGPIEDLSE